MIISYLYRLKDISSDDYIFLNGILHIHVLSMSSNSDEFSYLYFAVSLYKYELCLSRCIHSQINTDNIFVVIAY